MPTQTFFLFAVLYYMYHRSIFGRMGNNPIVKVRLGTVVDQKEASIGTYLGRKLYFFFLRPILIMYNCTTLVPYLFSLHMINIFTRHKYYHLFRPRWCLPKLRWIAKEFNSRRCGGNWIKNHGWSASVSICLSSRFIKELTRHEKACLLACILLLLYYISLQCIPWVEF